MTTFKQSSLMAITALALVFNSMNAATAAYKVKMSPEQKAKMDALFAQAKARKEQKAQAGLTTQNDKTAVKPTEEVAAEVKTDEKAKEAKRALVKITKSTRRATHLANFISYVKNNKNKVAIFLATSGIGIWTLYQVYMAYMDGSIETPSFGGLNFNVTNQCSVNGQAWLDAAQINAAHLWNNAQSGSAHAFNYITSGLNTLNPWSIKAPSTPMIDLSALPYLQTEAPIALQFPHAAPVVIQPMFNITDIPVSNITDAPSFPVVQPTEHASMFTQYVEYAQLAYYTGLDQLGLLD